MRCYLLNVVPNGKPLEQILDDRKDLERIFADPIFLTYLEVQAVASGYTTNNVIGVVLTAARMYGESREEEIRAEALALQGTMAADLVRRIKNEAGIVYYDWTDHVIASQNMNVPETELREHVIKMKPLVGYVYKTSTERLKLALLRETSTYQTRTIVYLHQDDVQLSDHVISGSESPASFLRFYDSKTDNTWLLSLSPELCREVVTYFQIYHRSDADKINPISQVFGALFPEKTILDPKGPSKVHLIDASNAALDSSGLRRHNDCKVEVLCCW